MRLGRFYLLMALHPHPARQARDDAAAGAVMLQNGNMLFQSCDIAATLS